MKNWRAPVIMLMTIGIANIGAWIYLIAMNLLVLEMTGGSALAVYALLDIERAKLDYPTGVNR